MFSTEGKSSYLCLLFIPHQRTIQPEHATPSSRLSLRGKKSKGGDVSVVLRVVFDSEPRPDDRNLRCDW